jgi:NAD(P)-dependent dehydrogenase (short-subunit alcohol dehydrogenase family)
MKTLTSLPNQFRLDDKTILVTGASSGIGHAVAVQCARAGAKIIATGRDPERLEAVFSVLEGGGHRKIVADLNDSVQMDMLADESGAVDGVVHSAGMHGVIPMRMASEKMLSSVMHTNYNVPMLLTQRQLARRLLRDGSSVLLLASIAALTGKVGVGPYSGSKGALIGTMRCLALEVAKRGIRVNAVCPGMVDTPLLNMNPEWLEEQGKNYPLGIGMPDDVAFAAIYFLSDASKKVTGTSFSLDGGVTFT